MDQLRAHPNLIPLVQRILDLADDSLPDKPSAHQVEDQAFTLMRELGGKVLGDWSQSAHDNARKEAQRLREDLIVHRKKKSSGTADSDPSK
jgi:hypothetical protein